MGQVTFLQSAHPILFSCRGLLHDFVRRVQNTGRVEKQFLRVGSPCVRVCFIRSDKSCFTDQATMALPPEEKQDLIGVGMSLLIHVALLLFLSLFLVKDEIKQVVVTILSSPVEEEAVEQARIEDITHFSETETRIVASTAQEPEPIVVEDDTPQQEVNLDDGFASDVAVDPVMEPEILASEYVPRTAGEGARSEGVANVGGVVDRLTAEIVSSATQKETLVVWLFDASLSLNAQRTQIADRLHKILTEIKADAELYAIRHVVCAFGKDLDVIIEEPSQEKEKIVREIKEVPLDESGVENIFASVETLAKKYKSTHNKRTLLIAFTDEVGDDRAKADQAIDIAAGNGLVVYVVGTPAPFGMSKTQLKFVDPDEEYDQTSRWVEIEQGPESLFKMTLNISSLPIDSEPMDSGFGPYALSRLCASTGGIYFALHPNRHVGSRIASMQIQPMASKIQHFFDSQVMRAYPPDYRSEALQAKEASFNPAKRALVQACLAEHVDVQVVLKTFFDAPNQGQFVNELSDAQKPVASLLEKTIDPLHKILKSGEKASASLKEPRWRASYLLAMGRVLAIKTRLDVYNAMLADAKSGLKAKNKDTNRWILEPADSPAVFNAMLAKQSESARKYLQTVIKGFPNTPWALIAQKELDVPLSYKWVESRFKPIAMNQGGNVNAPRRAPEDDKKRVLPKPKPQRKVDKI